MSDLPAALNIVSIAIGFVAGVCFCFGAATTTPESIAKASATIIGSNPTLMRSLSAQRSQYIVGALFLTASFLLQSAVVVIPKDTPLPLPLLFQSPYVLLPISLLFSSTVAVFAISRATRLAEAGAQMHLQLLRENQ